MGCGGWQVGCKDVIAKGGGIRVHTYGDLGQMAYGSTGRLTVDILICVSQIGCCVSYLIFLGQNVSSVVTGVTTRSADFIFIMIVFQILLASVRSLSSLAPFSIFADVCNIAAMALVIKDDPYSGAGFRCHHVSLPPVWLRGLLGLRRGHTGYHHPQPPTRPVHRSGENRALHWPLLHVSCHDVPGS
jgi:hypothetical protein